MKRVTSSSLFYFVCLLSLITFFGCGDTEDTAETIASDLTVNETGNTYGLIDVPDDWYMTKNPKLRNDYFRAILIKQFGDIPEVHVIAEYQRKRVLGISPTIDERNAFLEAQVRLWPNKKNKDALKYHKRLQEMEETEDPEVFAKLFREDLVEQFGDIPEVDILVKVEKKFKANEVVSDDEYLAYLKARFFLFPNKDTLREIQEAIAEQNGE